MREILFRGKRADNGEYMPGSYGDWVYGSYGLKLNVATGEHDEYIMESVYNGATNSSYFVDYKIIPGTVGQATGRKDQNDDNVFEGDMFLDVTTQEKFTIEWDEEDLAFVAMRDDRSRADYLSDRWSPVTCVIIGNIHDEEE